MARLYRLAPLPHLVSTRGRARGARGTVAEDRNGVFDVFPVAEVHDDGNGNVVVGDDGGFVCGGAANDFTEFGPGVRERVTCHASTVTRKYN